MSVHVKPKVLIVEDDLNNHPLYQEVFRMIDFEVAIFQTADGDFVSEVAKFNPDIISMDLIIGKDGAATERDGFQAIELLKSDERTKNIPIMVLTNFSDEHKVMRAKELGVIDFLCLQGQTINRVPGIYMEYLNNPKGYMPSHPLLRQK